MISKIDPNTGEPVERQANTDTASNDKDEDKAFVLKKKIYLKDSQRQENDSEVDIKNPALWDLLKEILGHFPNHIFRGTPVTLESPYEAFVFNWESLQEAAEAPPTDERDRQAREDLKSLLDIISGGSSGDGKLDAYFKARGAYREKGMIGFEHLWTIFPPGKLIWGNPFQKQDQLFVVQDSVNNWPVRSYRGGRFKLWTLNCWTYDWNGENFQRTLFQVEFESFDGHRPLNSLQFYPFELHLERQKVTEQLIKRGKEFRKLCLAPEGLRLFQYDGNTIFSMKGFGFSRENEVRTSHRKVLDITNQHFRMKHPTVG